MSVLNFPINQLSCMMKLKYYEQEWIWILAIEIPGGKRNPNMNISAQQTISSAYLHIIRVHTLDSGRIIVNIACTLVV